MAEQNLKAALELAEKGFHVIPLTWPSFRAAWCTTPGKQPMIRDWPNMATVNAEKIQKWFTRWSSANVGIKTGKVSGIVVLDIDPKNGGDESLEGLIMDYGPLPATVEVLTGSGGRHIYFNYPGGQKISDKNGSIAPGLDIKADGGQVVAPPSLHPNGRRYEWELSSHPDDMPLANMPDWLLALINNPNAETSSKPALSEDAPIPEGARDSTLTRIAGSFRRQGLNAEEIVGALQPINEKRCRPPLADADIKKIAKSVGRYQPVPEGSKDDHTPPEWKNLYSNKRYKVEYGWLYFRKDDNDELLSNFLVEPTKEITRDNGQETFKEFEFRGLLNGRTPLPTIAIPAEKFNGLTWITTEWGLRATIAAGAMKKDKLREAIQSVAKNLRTETVFAHLGWRRINGKWVYLHAGGCVGSDSVLVDVGRDGLSGYTIVTNNDSSVENAKFALKALDVAPRRITIPLLAQIGLAPLCEPLRKAGHEPAFLSFLVGQTMTKKSSLAAVFLSFFGKFTSTTLPGNFKDTINAIERKGFACKDSIFCIDDYHPTTSVIDAARMRAMAQALARTYGDRAARSRLSNDAKTVQQAYVPRGLALVTGEDQLDIGQSGTARFLNLEVRRGEVQDAVLTDLQLNTDKLTSMMHGYLQFLAPQMDELPNKLQQAFLQFRGEAGKDCSFARLPEVTAWLFVGINKLLQYFKTIDAITESQRTAIIKEAWETLVSVARRQAQQISEETPVNKFITALQEMLGTGAIRLNGNLYGDSDYMADDSVGWEDSDFFYLSPGKTFAVVVDYYKKQESRFPVTAQTLWRQLHNDGKIYVKNPKESFTNVKWIHSKNKRVISLYRAALTIEQDNEQLEQVLNRN